MPTSTPTSSTGSQEFEGIPSQDASTSPTNQPTPVAISAPPESSQPTPSANPDSSASRIRRVIRSIFQWLAIIAGLLCLGLLAGFILLYQPVQRELADARQRLNQSEQTAAQRQTDLEQAQADRENALKETNKAQSELKLANYKNQILAVMIGVNSARVALLIKDGATAKSAIEQALLDLSRVIPFLETQDKNRSDVLKARLELAGKEMVSDPAAALADLDKLSTDLAELYKKLFPN